MIDDGMTAWHGLNHTHTLCTSTYPGFRFVLATAATSFLSVYHTKSSRRLGGGMGTVVFIWRKIDSLCMKDGGTPHIPR